MSLKTPVNNNDHIQGNQHAPIELVEYGDYECSYCGQSYPVVKQLQEQLGEKLKVVFRNFPLTEIHPHALNAAIAAEVAADFGKFWEMHDILYNNQAHLHESDLLGYAKQLGIDPKAFAEKFDDEQYRERIDADIESGLRSGVNGTPTFYINGHLYQGNPYAVEGFLEELGLE